MTLYTPGFSLRRLMGCSTTLVVLHLFDVVILIFHGLKELGSPRPYNLIRNIHNYKYLWDSCLKLDVCDWSWTCADNRHYYHTHTSGWRVLKNMIEHDINTNSKLELYRAHTPRAHCAIYRSAFVAAWLYQELIDPISLGCII